MTRNTRKPLSPELLIAQSDRAMNWMIIWFCISIIGCILTVFVWMSPNVHKFGIAVSVSMLTGGFFVACIQAFKYARFNRLMSEPPAPPPPPRDMPTGRPMFESETTPRIMVRTSHNQWLLSRYNHITQRQWRMLYDALVNYDGLWSRDYSIKSSGIFAADETGIIYGQAGVYTELRDDFERMGIIEKRGGSWYVTDDGWNRLDEMAGVM